MVGNKPRVSIGMPVFNGEKYIRQALDSILAQTYQDFELIISDNASTDDTPQICRVYAAKDNRIRYYRNKRNLGATRNFNRVFELSSGVYFKWAAYDDVISPDFLEKCVRVLDQDPSIVLCHSKTARIDEDGVVVGTYDSATNDSEKPHERLRVILSKKGFPWMIFGVMRADALRMTPLLRDYIGSDWNLLAEISLIGRIYEIPEYLFFRRDHPDAYTRKHYSKRITANYKKESAWWGGNKRMVLIIIPNFRNGLEFFKSVSRAPISWHERLLCYKEITRWFYTEGWRLMKWDVACALNSFRLNLTRT
ncbi:MAG: glycosyltransferase [Candidatus Bathyarchaeia archaeon]